MLKKCRKLKFPSIPPDPNEANVLTGRQLYTNVTLSVAKIDSLLHVSKVVFVIHGFLNAGDEPWLKVTFMVHDLRVFYKYVLFFVVIYCTTNTQ